MSKFVLSAIDPEVNTASFLEAAAEGKVRFHTVRSDGTVRRVQFFAPDSELRALARWIREQREAGRTMKSIAFEKHLSVSSVRRLLNSLALVETVEECKPKKLGYLLGLARKNKEVSL